MPEHRDRHDASFGMVLIVGAIIFVAFIGAVETIRMGIVYLTEGSE